MRFARKSVTATVAALSLAFTGATASAAVLASTGVPVGGTSYALFGPSADGFDQSLAGYATFSGPVQIQSVKLWGDGQGLITLSLYEDGGLPAGPALFSVSGSISAPVESFFGFDGLSWDLAAGSYWFAFEPADEIDGGFIGGARNGAPSPLQRYAFTNEVPVPRSWNRFDDLGAGFLIEGTGVVPEPGTWALMIGGFGLAGAALRRRREALA